MRKTAIVTGGSNGIGKEAVIMLIDEGIDVLFTYLNDLESAEKLVLYGHKKGVATFAIKANMASMPDVNNIFCSALSALGHIDILLNNAGVFVENTFLKTTESEYDFTMDVIAKGAFFLTQSVCRHMIEHQIKGRIINISSSVTKDPKGSPPDYCMAKASINIFTKAVAASVGEFGITCNAILPGAIPTNINSWQFEIEEIRKRFLSGSPLQKIGNTKYIASAIKYFISEDAEWTTGSLLSVDGGYTI